MSEKEPAAPSPKDVNAALERLRMYGWAKDADLVKAELDRLRKEVKRRQHDRRR